MLRAAGSPFLDNVRSEGGDDGDAFAPSPQIVRTSLTDSLRRQEDNEPEANDSDAPHSLESHNSTSKRVPSNITCHCTVCLTPEPPKGSRPIRADIRTFNFAAFLEDEHHSSGRGHFDAIMMDPPWQLAGQAPSRGVSLMYDQLHDRLIEDMRIDLLQQDGLLFIWVINNKFVRALDIMETWGYRYLMDIAWVKRTIHRKLAKCHGYYLQHAKETCLVGIKGNIAPEILARTVGSDVIFSERRGQSQKPVEIYELIERIFPDGRLLEVFGRRHNLRPGWVTIGNEL